MTKNDSLTGIIQCWHCGQLNSMRILGSISDIEEYLFPNGESWRSGTIYELLVCPKCSGLIVQSDVWNEIMERKDWTPSVNLPTPEHHKAMELLAQHEADLKFMQMAVEQARKCVSEPGRVSPLVGAVVARGSELIAAAFRGEQKAGEHAEYTLLEGKCADIPLAQTTLYTTLEPCTSRNVPKVPCVGRVIERRISRVVIGMLDPNDVIRGRGVLALREAGIQVDLFPHNLMNDLEELNRAFIRAQA